MVVGMVVKRNDTILMQITKEKLELKTLKTAASSIRCFVTLDMASLLTDEESHDGAIGGNGNPDDDTHGANGFPGMLCDFPNGVGHFIIQPRELASALSLGKGKGMVENCFTFHR